MKLKDYIAELSKLDGELEIFAPDYGCGCCGSSMLSEPSIPTVCRVRGNDNVWSVAHYEKPLEDERAAVVLP